MRPHGLGGRPFAVFSSTSVQLAPPSAVWKSPLPLGAVEFSPPERNVHPFRRKSHMPAKRIIESRELIESIEHPVDGFTPFRILAQDFPPSLVLSTPRSLPSPQSFPGTQTYTVFVSLGSIKILDIRSDSFRPMLVQLSPPSVDL